MNTTGFNDNSANKKFSYYQFKDKTAVSKIK